MMGRSIVNSQFIMASLGLHLHCVKSHFLLFLNLQFTMCQCYMCECLMNKDQTLPNTLRIFIFSPAVRRPFSFYIWEPEGKQALAQFPMCKKFTNHTISAKSGKKNYVKKTYYRTAFKTIQLLRTP